MAQFLSTMEELAVYESLPEEISDIVAEHEEFQGRINELETDLELEENRYADLSDERDELQDKFDEQTAIIEELEKEIKLLKRSK